MPKLRDEFLTKVALVLFVLLVVLVPSSIGSAKLFGQRSTITGGLFLISFIMMEILILFVLVYLYSLAKIFGPIVRIRVSPDNKSQVLKQEIWKEAESGNPLVVAYLIKQSSRYYGIRFTAQFTKEVTNLAYKKCHEKGTGQLDQQRVKEMEQQRYFLTL